MPVKMDTEGLISGIGIGIAIGDLWLIVASIRNLPAGREITYAL